MKLVVVLLVVVACASCLVSGQAPPGGGGSGQAPQCTDPSSMAPPLTAFDAKRFEGNWYEIATSGLVRSAMQPGCACTTANYTLVESAEAAQALGGRALFDIVYSCRDGSGTGAKRWMVGQMLQLNAQTKPSTFDQFLVPAQLSQDGKSLEPAQPPQPQPQPQPQGAPQQQQQQLQATAAVAAPQAAPSDAELEANLNPNYRVLRAGNFATAAAGAPYDYAIVLGPCKETMWVMAREPQLDASFYDTNVLAFAKERGFDTDALGLTLTSQAGCPALSFP